jgi:invasion protein IalB
MKDVLTLMTFALGAVCFVMFVSTVKPDAMSAVPPPAKPEVCKTHGSWTPACGLHLFAAASGAVVPQRQ